MIRDFRLPTRFAGALLLVLIVLTGCGAAADAPTATPAPPAAGALAAPASTSTAAAAGTSSTPVVASQVGAATCPKLNLNTETQAQLTATIPNFPAQMLREFFEYRPYTSILEFRQAIGKYVDASQVTAWEQYVYVPVDANQSDLETLKQMPGVDAAVAATLISGRPYASTDAFRQALATHLTAAQGAAAGCYLAAQ